MSQYIRKGGHDRCSWDEANLVLAVKAIADGKLSLNRASKVYGIPRTTLQRRRKTGNTAKGSLGPDCELGRENERKIVAHVKRLQGHGFTPDTKQVRKMAFQMAQKLQIHTKFNAATELAGYPWLESFLRRNPDLRVRQAEGVSRARTVGMNRTDVSKYFKLLTSTMEENGLLAKPAAIFNMDETGLQLNNKPGKVLAAKGSRCVPAVTSGEKGETISVLACCNAEGVFLPPYCVFRGKNKKAEWTYGMPPGSFVQMNPKSAYVNSEIFFDWLKNHFLPRKPAGKVLLILDGHSSHTSDIEMLKFADANDIILLGFPSHTTHFLQPLDRAYFKSLKSFFYSACNQFIRNNPMMSLNRAVFGQLLSSAWNKSATVEIGVSGFRATGIVPLNPNVIPDYAFLTDHAVDVSPILSTLQSATLAIPCIPSQQSASSALPCTLSQPSSSASVDVSTEISSVTALVPQNASNAIEKTPGKVLLEISPIPEVKIRVTARAKAVSEIINSAESIARKEEAVNRKKTKEAETLKKKIGREEKKKEREEKKREREEKKKERANLKRMFDEHDDDDDDLDWESELKEEEEEPKELKAGVFVLVKVCGKTSFRLFVAKILQKIGKNLEVIFYKKAEKVTKFEETKEISFVSEDDVVRVLSAPLNGSSSRFKNMLGFSTDLKEYINLLD